MLLHGDIYTSSNAPASALRGRLACFGKVEAQPRAGRLQLYGLVQGLSYVVRLNDLKAPQHFRVRLAWVLRRPHDPAKPLHGDLKELFEISGLWVRNVGERRDLKLQIRRLIRRIVERVKIRRQTDAPLDAD